MAAKPPTGLLAALRWSQPAARLPRHAPALRRAPQARSSRLYSTTDDAPPPFLSKLKADLKTAMRAKDAPRLSVLRAIMSANLNASKTATPIKTDVQLVALIRKIQKSALDAAAEAQAAGRQDLVDKENEQARILDGYLADSGVQSLGEAELKALVQDAVEASRAAGTAAKSLMGDVMKRLAGALEGKDVDRKQVASLVKELTSHGRFDISAQPNASPPACTIAIAVWWAEPAEDRGCIPHVPGTGAPQPLPAVIAAGPAPTITLYEKSEVNCNGEVTHQDSACRDAPWISATIPEAAKCIKPLSEPPPAIIP
ncbi:hypothetical protein Purlil1_4621 [Purpureocillium lilacinum]|uniref:Altered inheritance of mitochondria protein 41 n=1 Tax=Purpureocillium lilacinum TaxID=33203 RepID=A0ABR0C4M8_PURLI|nr:hypothetical protein Purlil1_4621 [Purpureocillium lilacinum]